MKFTLVLCAFWWLMTMAFKPLAQTSEKTVAIDIALTLPKIDAQPYHKPFVAVWLETPERQPIATIAIWYDDAEWLKDLRQWWRKLGRQQHGAGQLDGLSGATQKAGVHTITWQGTAPVTEAFINLEVAREEGGRSYHRELISLNANGHFTIPPSDEFGETHIQVKLNN